MKNLSKPLRFAVFLNSALLLVLLVSAGTSVRADIPPPRWDYAARTTSTSTTAWDPPFWWIPSSGSAFGLETFTYPPGTPPRIGAYYHNTSNLTDGEGYGISLPADTLRGDGTTIVYLVSASMYGYLTESTDILVRLASTNAAIGVYPGRGTVNACTSFQAAYLANQWSPICYLTNNPGALHPEIEFHYVGGSSSNGRFLGDCIRFTLVPYAPPTWSLTAELDAMGFVRITWSCPYTPNILVTSLDPKAPPGSWTPVCTNNSTSGSWLAPPNSAPFALYRIKTPFAGFP